MNIHQTFTIPAPDFSKKCRETRQKTTREQQLEDYDLSWVRKLRQDYWRVRRTTRNLCRKKVQQQWKRKWGSAQRKWRSAQRKWRGAQRKWRGAQWTTTESAEASDVPYFFFVAGVHVASASDGGA